MPQSIRFLFALALLAIPPPVMAGSITYDFHNLQWPYFGLGRLVVDDGALSRGYVTEADATAFGFAPFFLADLTAFTMPISGDGTPTGQGSIGAERVVDGMTYSLYIEFGPDAFNPGIGGYYQASGGGSQGRYGFGYWTATIDATPAAAAAVPGPPGLVMACAACVCIVLARGAIPGHWPCPRLAFALRTKGKS